MPFSRRIGLSTSAWSTSSSTIGWASAATPSGEAAPDRYAHALLDLLLEPDGSAGDELVRLPVEHQHGRGVDLEHVPEPNQQLTHQLVETETDERRLQHSLHLLEPRSATALGLEQPSVLDRETHAVGDELEQLDVVLREDPRCQRTDVEHSEHVVREDQRHSGHALDALLAQDRVQHVGVVDVVEHDRSPFGGDPAREAAADRDPHALLDLFLEPDRRPRDQLVSEVVPEKNCGRVGVEHVPDSREELTQELVQVQVRQRRIRDELDSPETLGVTVLAHSRQRIRRSLAEPRVPLWPRGALLRSAG